MSRMITKEKLAAFKVFLTEAEKSRITIEKYLRDIKKFYRFLPDDKTVTKELVCRYKSRLMDSYRISSTNSMLAALNSYFCFMEWPDLKVKQIPVQRQMFCSEERELEREDYQRLLRAAAEKQDERLYLIMLTICSTGIRVSELAYVTQEAVRLGRAEVICKNKNRMVLLPGALKKQLLAYAKSRGIKKGSIFVTRNGLPVDRRNIWTAMKALSEAAGVAPEKVFPHNLRHLFARTYYQKEKDIIKLADILGHSNVETTRIYTCTTFQEHRLQIERLGLSEFGQRRFIH